MRGDFSGLTNIRRVIEAFEDGTVMRRFSRMMSEEARTQVSESFEQGVDPYDRAWPALKMRQGHPLRDTGRFMASFTTRYERDFFTVATNFIGAAVHQYGATIRAKNARYRFGGAGSDGADTVTAGKPMLVFKVGRGRSARWVSKESVTIPRRQYIPEGGQDAPRWTGAFQAAADVVIGRELQRLGVAY